MKVTKYPQSCLIVCKNGQCICIDPGTLLTEKYKIEDLGLIEAVLYTHQHADHFDPAIVQELIEKDIDIYANADVASKIQGKVTVIKDKEELVIAGFSVTAFDLPHFPIEGKEVPQNTGYLIDGTLFHPGDGLELRGLRTNSLAVAIGNPGPDPFGKALAFADEVEARKIIPIHYDGRYKADPEEFASKAGGDRVIILDSGQSAEIE